MSAFKCFFLFVAGAAAFHISPRDVEVSNVHRSNRAVQSGSRNVGGRPTSVSQHPYIAWITSHGGNCAGSIISEYWVITAAHSFDERNAYHEIPGTIRVGSNGVLSGGQEHHVKMMKRHPRFPGKRNPKRDFDISLFQVKLPFKFSDTVKPVPLPSSEQIIQDGTSGVVVGWNHNREGNSGFVDSLWEVEVPVWSNEKCKESVKPLFGDDVPSSQQLCAGGQGGTGACKGEWGGPLVVNGQLVGVISFGPGCRRPESPRVYTRVAAFRSWIRDNCGV